MRNPITNAAWRAPRLLIATGFFVGIVLLTVFLVSAASERKTAGIEARAEKSYLGFDRNDYPGDQNLAALRRTFSFAGYWLNPPPGAKSNTWTGKRIALKDAGFGFLVLFNGRLDAELTKNAGAVGRSDAEAALTAARHEGFSEGTVIFLDQEEGGRMLPEQKAYIYAWVDAVNAGGFRAGIYCSGISVPEGTAHVTTAEDIRERAGPRQIIYWIVNDACPPSPGCTFPRNSPRPSASGISFASVWQFARSPRQKEFAQGCSNYAPDGNCYAPELPEKRIHVDLESAESDDPSAGR
jgi:Domain of unknown function (DUF1906)